MTSFPFDALRRTPDLESPELVACDAADRYLLDTYGNLLDERPELRGNSLCILGDAHGGLTLGALAEYQVAEVIVHQDARSGELALDNNAQELAAYLPEESTFTQLPLAPELVTGATVVLMRLPRSLDQLDQWTALIAAHASPDVVVLAAGRIKHMSVSMNEVLAKYFSSVTASLAQQKSRVLTAQGPRHNLATQALAAWPKREHHQGIDLTICAQAGAFAGTSIDIGTYDLLAVLDRVSGKQGMRIIDFGCGTGVLAAQIAKLRPSATVIATDQSSAAVESARATMAENHLTEQVTVVRDDGLSSQPDGSADLILFNPPFHSGAAVHAGTSLRLFKEAGRVLKSGGELWVVANRHLSYKPALRKLVGETREVRRTPKFTVTRSFKG